MNIQQYKEKINNIYKDTEKIQVYEELFSQKDFSLENEEDWILYDQMFTSYWKLQSLLKSESELNDKISNNILQNAFKHLESNLPSDKSLEDTSSYESMLAFIYRKEDYIQIFPKRNSQEIRNRLVNPPSDLLDNSGNIIDFRKYDKVLIEYMQFNINEIDFSEVGICFEKLMNCSECKKKDIDDFYFYNFMRIEYEYPTTSISKKEIFNITNKFKNKIALNVLSEFYEMQSSDNIVKKLEHDILFQMFCKKDEQGETEITKCLSNFADCSEDFEKLVKYIIRIHDDYSGAEINDEAFKSIYDSIIGLDFSSLINKNFYVQEKMNKNQDTDFEKYFQGVEKTIALFAESKNEGYIATNNFLENDNYRYFSLGKLTNKTDFKSIEKFIEQTVDRCSYNLNDYSSSVIEEYIKNKINQPDFNIVQEPVFCELIQVYKDGRLAIDDMDFSFLDEKIEKEFGSEEVIFNKINNYLEKHKNKSVVKEEEEEFSEFLNYLSAMKISDENNILSQETIDFLLAQAIRKDSIVNQEREKYLPVIETAIADFAYHDYLNRTGEDEIEYVYSIRDYISADSVRGRHYPYGQVKIKRDLIINLFEGDLEVFNTIYHENEHMLQTRKKSKTPDNFIDYQICREDVIKYLWPEFYSKNYDLMYEEIDAREKAAQLTADYLEKIVSANTIDDILENVGNSVVDMISKSNKEVEKEQQNYSDAEIKRTQNGRMINGTQILDDLIGKYDKVLVREFFSKRPALEIEYDFDTMKKRDFNSLITLTRTGKYDYEMMRQIIRAGNTVETIDFANESSFDVFDTLIEWSEDIANKEVKNDNEKQCFMDICNDNFIKIFDSIYNMIANITSFEMGLGLNNFDEKNLNRKIFDGKNIALVKLHSCLEKLKTITPESPLGQVLNQNHDWVYLDEKNYLERVINYDEFLVTTNLFKQQKKFVEQSNERSFSTILFEVGFSNASIERIQNVVKNADTLNKKTQQKEEYSITQNQVNKNEKV